MAQMDTGTVPATRQKRLFSLFWSLLGQGIGGRKPQGVGIAAGDSAMIYGAGVGAGKDITMNPMSPAMSGAARVSNQDLPIREFGDWPDQRGQSNRRQRYAQYDMLEEMMPEIRAALQTYADEASNYDPTDHVLQIKCADQGVREELEWLYFKTLRLDERLWEIVYSLVKHGDYFAELVINEQHPEMGILGMTELDPATMWRIQDGRGQVIEFQQSGTSPDYEIVSRDILTRAANHTDEYADYLFWAGRTAENPNLVRFAPAQICHLRIGGKRKFFYPYGVSKLANVWRIAYDLKLVQDSMLCLRLTKGIDRRIFYVDIGQLAGPEVANYLEQFKNGIKRQKIWNDKTKSVDEDWNPLNTDDDLYIPMRPNGSTRVEPLPGAANLDQIDDAIYFRKILYLSLGIPQGYFEQTIESQTNRLTLSQLDIRFAKRILGVQKPVAADLMDIGRRHLTLLRVPASRFADLEVTITPASDWQTLSKAELLNDMFNRATTAKGTGMFPTRWILTEVMKRSDEEADQLIKEMNDQLLADADLAARVKLADARAQAEIDRATAINQQRNQEELTKLQSAAGGATPGAEATPAIPGTEATPPATPEGEVPATPEGEVPPESLVAGAFPPSENQGGLETPPAGGEATTPEGDQVNPGAALTASDRELDYEDRGW